MRLILENLEIQKAPIIKNCGLNERRGGCLWCIKKYAFPAILPSHSQLGPLVTSPWSSFYIGTMHDCRSTNVVGK